MATSGIAKEAFQLRAELVERSFALTLDRGGMRRAWLRGHVAGYNLGLIMRLLVGAGTPRELLARASAPLLAVTIDDAFTGILTVTTGTEAATLIVSIEPQPHD